MALKSVGCGVTGSKVEETVFEVTVDDRRGSNDEDVSMLERGGSSGSTSEKESTWAVGSKTLPGEVLHNQKCWVERILPILCQNIQYHYYSITLSETIAKSENGL